MDNLYYFVSFTLYYYLFYHKPFLFNLILLDNLLLSFNTISSIYKPHLIIQFYNNSYIDRYIYYIILFLINIVFKLLFFNHYPILTFILFLTTLPFIFSLILVKLNLVIINIKKRINKIYKFIVYNLISYMINNICYLTIQFNPCLHTKDISVIYKSNYKENINLFVKNFLLLTVIKSISNSNTYTLNLVKNIYNYKADYPYIDPYPNKKEVDKIKQILFKRNWNQFFNPYIINILISLYNNKGVDKITPFIENFINRLEIATSKLFTVLTLSQLTQSYLFIFFISLLLIHSYNTITLNLILFKLTGVLFSYIFNSYLIGALFCEYHELLFNKFIIWIYVQMKKWFKDNFYILTHYNKYNIILLYHVGFLSLFNFNLLTLLFIIINSQCKLLTLWFILFGYFSNYNFIHLFLLSVLYYISINLYYSNTAPRQKIPLLLLQNYKDDNKKTDIVKKKLDIVISNNYKPPSVYCPVLNCIHNPKYNVEPQ